MKRGQRQVTLLDCQVKKRYSINSTTESVQQGQPTQCNVEADKCFHGLIEGVHADFQENVTAVQDLETISVQTRTPERKSCKRIFNCC